MRESYGTISNVERAMGLWGTKMERDAVRRRGYAMCYTAKHVRRNWTKREVTSHAITIRKDTLNKLNDIARCIKEQRVRKMFRIVEIA